MNQDEHIPDPAGDDAAPARSLHRDLAGLALFAAAIFLGVSVFMSAQRPAEQAGGSTGMVTSLVGWLGFWPLLALSACLMLLGGRLWVAGALAGLGRNLLASLGLCLTLSVLCGASATGAGGAFGALLGGNLSGVLSVFVGVPIALALVAGVIWVAWLRPPESAGIDSTHEPAPSVYTPAESEGLTVDEAEALLPSRAPQEAPQPPLQPSAETAPKAALSLEQITGRSIPVDPDLPPLYPPDVRREGRIPEGARALEARDESASARVTRDPAPATPADEPELAAAAPVEAAAEEPQPEPAGDTAAPAALHAGADAPAGDVGGSALPDLAPSVPRWERSRDVAPVEESASAQAASEAPASSLARPISVLPAAQPPVRSAWELSESEDEDAEELEDDLEEPEEALSAEESGDLVAEADADEEEEEEEDAVAELDDDEEYEEEDEEEEYEEGEYAEDEEESEDEEEEEEDDEDDEEAAIDLDEDEEYEEEEDEESEEPDEAAAELEEPEAEVEELPEGETRTASARRAAWEQAGLFDDEPVDAYGTPVTLVDSLRQANEATAKRLDGQEEPDTVDQEPAAEADAESEVVLQPVQAAEPKPTRKPTKKQAKKQAKQAAAADSAASDPADDLVYRAGMLFLERGRVAVSMLQRSFDLDFKQATALLDQLQEGGLIGPYLGGQRRDILLTAEEWRERRVGAS